MNTHFLIIFFFWISKKMYLGHLLAFFFGLITLLPLSFVNCAILYVILYFSDFEPSYFAPFCFDGPSCVSVLMCPILMTCLCANL